VELDPEHGREMSPNHSEIPPGKLNCPVHCHSSEEEVFVVLEGDGGGGSGSKLVMKGSPI
jgi:uncharacterized cupin superfamily protein